MWRAPHRGTVPILKSKLISLAFCLSDWEGQTVTSCYLHSGELLACGHPPKQAQGSTIRARAGQVVVAEVRGDWYEKRKMGQSLSYLYNQCGSSKCVFLFVFITSTSIIILMIVHFCNETLRILISLIRLFVLHYQDYF